MNTVKTALTAQQSVATTVSTQVQRCLGMLDQIDYQIIESGTFSTPFDLPLEQLRSELTALAQQLNLDSAAHTHTSNYSH